MKKKLLYLFLAFIGLSLIGCDKANNDSTEGSNTEEAAGTTDTTALKGTLANPYSIAEAIEVIGTNSSISSTQIYIKGYVNSSPYYNSKYSSYSSYLIDENGTSTVQVYSGTIDSKAGYSDVKEGDLVIAGGYYMYYTKNSQPELGGDSSHSYPVYYNIVRSGASTTTYETLDDNGKETITTKIEFTEDNLKTMAGYDDSSKFKWTSGIVSMEYDEGTQYSCDFTKVNPLRFYVGTYLHFRVSSGTIKYISFETDSNYPFTIEMPVTYGQMEVSSNTLTYIFAKTGTNYIKIHNSNNGETKNVLVKQARIYSMTVVSYK